MKSFQPFIALSVGMILIAGAGAALRNVDQNRVIGAPGLRMGGSVVTDENGGILHTNTVALPQGVLGYRSTPVPITKVELGFLPPDTTYARRLYTNEIGYSIQVGVVMMGRDRSSIHKPQYCLTGQGWKILSESEVKIELSGDNRIKLPVWKMVAERDAVQSGLKGQTVRAIYLYWFVAENHITARHGERMLWSAAELLRSGTLQRWSYVSVLAFCLPGEEERLYERLTEFVSTLAPTFHVVSESTRISGYD